MNCSRVMDLIYNCSKNNPDMSDCGSISLFNQIQISIHTLFCQDCTQKIEKYEAAKSVMRESFFPQPPYLEDSVMAKIAMEEPLSETSNVIPGGISTLSWVIAGLVLMISLVTAFFGLEFQNLASESGISFMLPMGITIGIILTTYCAFFIGSHLKQLSERFGL